MVAYQYANYYAQLSEQYEEASHKAQECLEVARLDNTPPGAEDAGESTPAEPADFRD